MLVSVESTIGAVNGVAQVTPTPLTQMGLLGPPTGVTWATHLNGLKSLNTGDKEMI